MSEVPEPVSRRGWLLRCLRLGVATTLAAIFYPVVRFLWPRAATRSGSLEMVAPYRVHELRRDGQGQWLIRSAHSWSANLLVGILLLHVLTTYMMRAYRGPREMTWLTGILLLGLFMAFGFSGYLLPWNELAFFATRVGTAIVGVVPLVGDQLLLLARGGENVTGDTLARFYALYVVVFPLITFARAVDGRCTLAGAGHSGWSDCRSEPHDDQATESGKRQKQGGRLFDRNHGPHRPYPQTTQMRNSAKPPATSLIVTIRLP